MKVLDSFRRLVASDAAFKLLVIAALAALYYRQEELIDTADAAYSMAHEARDAAEAAGSNADDATAAAEDAARTCMIFRR